MASLLVGIILTFFGLPIAGIILAIVLVVKKKLYTRRGFYIFLSIFLFIITSIGFLVAGARFAGNQEVLREIASPSPGGLSTMTPNWYFFSNDKIYAYLDDSSYGFYEYGLRGNNARYLASGYNIRYPYFYMVKDGEAYFYEDYSESIKKVDLETGEQTTLVEEKFLNLLPDTLEEEKVLVTYTNYYIGQNYGYFGFLDLRTGQLTEEKYLKRNMIQPYYYAQEDGSVYYVAGEQGAYNIYKDNEIIYTYKTKNTAEHDLVFTQDGYIFAMVGDEILRLSMDDYVVLERKHVEGSYDLVRSGSKGAARKVGAKERSTSVTTLENPVFRQDEDIYVFNSETMSFEKIIEGDTSYDYVRKYGEYLVLENVLNVLVYNVETGTSTKFNASNYTVEDGYIYLMTYVNGFYTGDVEFEVKKIALTTL